MRGGPGDCLGLLDIGHVDRSAGPHRLTRERGVVDRQGEFLEVHRDGIVLRQHEVQPRRTALRTARRGGRAAPADLPQRPRRPRRIAKGQVVGLAVAVGVRRLQHVHAACIGAGNPAALVENQVEQLADVAF